MGMLGRGVYVLDKQGERDTEAMGVAEAVRLGTALLEGTPAVAEDTAENGEEGEVHGVAVGAGDGVPEDGCEKEGVPEAVSKKLPLARSVREAQDEALG